MTVDIHHNNSDLDARVRYAQTLASANLLPKAYRDNPANVLLATELGDALGIPAVQAINSIHVIEGKPSASADLIASLVRRAGHKLRIREEETTNGPRVTATLIRKDDPEFEFVAVWDMTKARAANLAGKAVWKQYPGQMLRSRAITEVCRQGAGDALFGVIYSPEELGQDGPPATVHTVVQEPAVSPSLSITDAITEPETEPVEAERVPDFAALVDAMASAGVDKLEMPGYATSVLGREVKSGGDLTADEVDMVVEALTAAATA